MLAIELTPSTKSSAGCFVSFSAFRTPATSLVTPVAVSLWVKSTALICVALVGGERLLIALDRRALAPLGVEHVHLEAETLGHVDPQMAEHAEPGGETRSPGESVLESEASHAPVPLAGKMNACPDVVLKIFLSFSNRGAARLGNGRTMVLHRNVHGAEHTIGHIRRARDEEEIAAGHRGPLGRR